MTNFRSHDLKTYPFYFNAVLVGMKKFEVRKNDRDFKIGDFLYLKEFDPKSKSFTGRSSTHQIIYILPGGQFGIEEGYVVLGLD